MLKIHKATVQDIPEIQSIAKTTWPVAFDGILSQSQLDYMMRMMYNTQELTSQIEGGKIIFWLAAIGKQSLGFMAYESQLPIQPQIKIHKLYILPAAQGKGVGKGLLNNLEEYGRSNGFETVTLNVNKYNSSAIKFYEKRGFEKIKAEIIPIGQDYIMDDYVFTKKL
ncbi:GNAT family N-acetyltransferase [Cyclobacterium qasimii]|uniref:N-acetyltransferase n=2 Tax=Cyclobacterium qasimii TaxID=1350429 RepID=A0A512CF55_9BACT|nr:GNAT family N-acetyltransferase [Cyclobacterium qasimii]EPR69378.1 putative acetyltransferase [Cyclobacterium qasimii M12-11B]GEO22861.1 N-acetyltransferase [Cyclobacterium qasimii]